MDHSEFTLMSVTVDVTIDNLPYVNVLFITEQHHQRDVDHSEFTLK